MPATGEHTISAEVSDLSDSIRDPQIQASTANQLTWQVAVDPAEIALTATARSYGVASRVQGTLTAGGDPLAGSVEVSVDGALVGTVAVVDGAFALDLPATLRAGDHAILARQVGGSAQAATTVVIAKATSRLEAKVQSVRLRGKNRVYLRAHVSIVGSTVVPTGLVEVSAPGLAPRTGTLDAQGRTSIELPANVHSWNRAKVVVTYLGSSDVLPSKVTFRTLGRR